MVAAKRERIQRSAKSKIAGGEFRFDRLLVRQRNRARFICTKRAAFHNLLTKF